MRLPAARNRARVADAFHQIGLARAQGDIAAENDAEPGDRAAERGCHGRGVWLTLRAEQSGDPPALPRQAEMTKKDAVPPARELSCRPSHAFLPRRLGGEIPHAAFQSARQDEHSGSHLFENVVNPFCGTLGDDLDVERTLGPQGRQERLQPVGRGLRAQASPPALPSTARMSSSRPRSKKRQG